MKPLPPYGEPVSTFADLETLDPDEIVEGYRDGRENEPEPTGNRSRAYWHGWRNGQVDGGHAQPDDAMILLIGDMRRRGKLGNARKATA